MPKPIGFHATSSLIVIDDNGVFPPRSLTAYPSPNWQDRIQIDDLAGKGVQNVLWGDVTSLDGSYTPASMADALAYIQGELAKGPDPIVGPRGPGVYTAAGDPDPAFGLAGDLYIDAVSGDLYQKGA